MGNSLDIYNTLLRIERNNHIAKRKDALLIILEHIDDDVVLIYDMD